MDGPTLLSHLGDYQEEMLATLRLLVEHESPSTEKPLLDALAALLAERFAAAGAQVDMIPSATNGNHLQGHFASPYNERPALVVCHYDTVWSAGTLATMPFRVEGERVYGPGVFDMKASIVLAEFALRTIADLQATLPRPVIVLLTSDEEIGSPLSRSLIESLAREAAYVLVMEPPLTGGALKTGRKGIGRFALAIEGRASHAGTEPEKGHSAIEELAHQVLALHQLRDKNQGSTVNVGVVRGGTRPNVVAAHAELEIDVRAWTAAESTRLTQAILGMQPVTAGVVLHPSGGFNRPPMERSPKIVHLFERVRTIAVELGLDLKEGQTGGGSDANFTAALGVPTLDGLGMPGAGAHADHEHILTTYLPLRAALLALLLLRL